MEHRDGPVRSLTRRISSKVLTFLRWFALSTAIWLTGIIAVALYEKSLYEEPTTSAYSTAHFTIINEGVAKSDAQAVSDELEQHYARILDDFGILSIPHVVVRLYPKGSREFEDESGQAKRENLQGFVGNSSVDTMYLQWAKEPNPDQPLLEEIGIEQFVRRVALHEFAHLVEHNVLYEKAMEDGWVTSRADWRRTCLYNRTHTYCDVPGWWSEAVAQYEGRAMATKELLTEYESRAASLEPTRFTNEDAYTYGRLLGEFVYKKWGTEGLHDMVTHNADTSAALGVSADEFNAGFREYAAERMKGLLLQYKYTKQVTF